MSVPRKAKRQAEEARRLQEQYIADRNQEPAPAEPEPEPEPQPGPEPEPEPVESAEPEPEGGDDRDPPQPDAEPRAPEGRYDDPKYWRDRFTSLYGKYNAEVPRLHRELADLRAEVDRLREQPPPPASDPAPRGDPSNAETLLTDEERDELGDLAPVVARLASRIADARVEPLHSDLRRDRERQAKSQRERFLEELDRAHPDWREVNADPEFHAWLAEAERYSGRVRNDLLNEAGEALDAHRVIAFFTDFKAWRGDGRGPAADPPPDPSRKVTPDPARGGGAPSGGPEPRIWTNSEVQQFFTDKAHGRLLRNWRLTEEQAAAMERDIAAAAREGRIR